MSLLPSYFISHGGGPWSFMKEEVGDLYLNLSASLKKMSADWAKPPQAILAISAHWESDDDSFSVMTSVRPPMLYDYSGFPDYTYHIQYPAPGSPALAEKVILLLEKAGLKATRDGRRGFDHGVFTPFHVILPKADIPVVQLSIRHDYDPEVHLQLGRALSSLREQNVVIIGSGLSYHNLRQFGGPQAAVASRQFDDWLQESLLRLTPQERTQRLLNWEKAPSARFAHPQEDHLIPLMVAVGAAENEKATCIYHENNFANGLSVSSYRFG